VQLPLDLNWRGRSWCDKFSTSTVTNTGAMSMAHGGGTFGVTIQV
jgi:hypothetical protein